MDMGQIPVAATPSSKEILKMFKKVEEEDEDLLTAEDVVEIEQSIKDVREGHFRTQEYMKAKYGL